MSKTQFCIINVKRLSILRDRYKFFEEHNNYIFKVRSLKSYLKVLIDYYWCSKKYLKDENLYKNIISSLSNEIKNKCYLMNKEYYKELTVVEKVKYRINSKSPDIYYFLCVLKHILFQNEIKDFIWV